MSDDILSPRAKDEEEEFEKALGPKWLSDVIGRKKIKETLSVFIDATKRRGEALDHLLFCGPPGLGKTTLAYIMAREMSVDIKVTSGPVIDRPGDLAAILTNLKEDSCSITAI